MNTDTTHSETGNGNHSLADFTISRLQEALELRELLNRAIEIAETLEKKGLSCGQLIDLHHEINAVKELARLAPAPEEPVSEGTRIAAEARSACNDLTEEERKRYASLAEDVLKLHRSDEGSVWAKHGLSEPTEPATEWRELGEDEVICEGDEFQEKQYDPIKNKWYTIYECSMVGKKVSDSDWGRFRTRRPLPTTNCKQISSKLVVEPKQEEKITFEDELSVIFNCDQHSVVEARYATVGAFRYLRDEIQELKQK